MVPRGGFEPPACPLGGDRSILLSYRGKNGADSTIDMHLIHDIADNKALLSRAVNRFVSYSEVGLNFKYDEQVNDYTEIKGRV